MPKSITAEAYAIRQVQDAIKATGELIAAARKSRKWSQTELGERLGGVDRRQISALEKGEPGVDFGLVISALWILDLPILATLPDKNRPVESESYPYLLNVVASANKRSRDRLKDAVSSLQPSKVIDNDF